MKTIQTSLPGVLIIEPQVFSDERGFFLETFSKKRYAELGITCEFVQDNHSHSAATVLRGLHYQVELEQDKLVSVLSGKVIDVAVDVRRGSPHFGKWVQVELSAANHRQLFIPAGFAHGLYVLEETDFLYKCSAPYSPQHERGIIFDDRTLGISWPSHSPLLSPRDAALPALDAISMDDLPRFEK